MFDAMNEKGPFLVLTKWNNNTKTWVVGIITSAKIPNLVYSNENSQTF